MAAAKPRRCSIVVAHAIAAAATIAAADTIAAAATIAAAHSAHSDLGPVGPDLWPVGPPRRPILGCQRGCQSCQRDCQSCQRGCQSCQRGCQSRQRGARAARGCARAARGVPELPFLKKSFFFRCGRSSQGRFFSPKNVFLRKNIDFLSKKKSCFRAIQAHHEYRGVCPVIFHYTRVQKVQQLDELWLIKVGEVGSASPAPNVDRNPGWDPPLGLLY